jgi:hypothetical protein
LYFTSLKQTIVHGHYEKLIVSHLVEFSAFCEALSFHLVFKNLRRGHILQKTNRVITTHLMSWRYGIILGGDGIFHTCTGWRWSPPSQRSHGVEHLPLSSAEVKERVELNFCSLSGLSRSEFYLLRFNIRGTRWRSLLRHCATSRKVADSIPDDSFEFFVDMILPAALWPWGCTVCCTKLLLWSFTFFL